MSIILNTNSTITVNELTDINNSPVVFTHPVVNQDLLEKWSPEEIRNATSLQTAIDNNQCTVTYNGIVLTNLSLFGLSDGFYEFLPTSDLIDDQDDTYFYWGWQNINGNWLIRRIDRTTSIQSNANSSINSSYTDLSTAWTDRLILNYS